MRRFSTTIQKMANRVSAANPSTFLVTALTNSKQISFKVEGMRSSDIERLNKHETLIVNNPLQARSRYRKIHIDTEE